MDLVEFSTTISNLGFPIALTVYLLTRFEKKLDNFASSIDHLSKQIGLFKKE